jgi:hypothetical protein
MKAIISFVVLVCCLHFFEAVSPFVAKAILKISIPLPKSPVHWDYRYVPPCLALRVIISIKTKKYI